MAILDLIPDFDFGLEDSELVQIAHEGRPVTIQVDPTDEDEGQNSANIISVCHMRKRGCNEGA